MKKTLAWSYKNKISNEYCFYCNIANMLKNRWITAIKILSIMGLSYACRGCRDGGGSVDVSGPASEQGGSAGCADLLDIALVQHQARTGQLRQPDKGLSALGLV